MLVFRWCKVAGNGRWQNLMDHLFARQRVLQTASALRQRLFGRCRLINSGGVTRGNNGVVSVNPLYLTNCSHTVAPLALLGLQASSGVLSMDLKLSRLRYFCVPVTCEHVGLVAACLQHHNSCHQLSHRGT